VVPVDGHLVQQGHRPLGNGGCQVGGVRSAAVLVQGPLGQEPGDQVSLREVLEREEVKRIRVIIAVVLVTKTSGASSESRRNSRSRWMVRGWTSRAVAAVRALGYAPDRISRSRTSKRRRGGREATSMDVVPRSNFRSWGDCNGAGLTKTVKAAFFLKKVAGGMRRRCYGQHSEQAWTGAEDSRPDAP